MGELIESSDATQRGELTDDDTRPAVVLDWLTMPAIGLAVAGIVGAVLYAGWQVVHWEGFRWALMTLAWLTFCGIRAAVSPYRKCPRCKGERRGRRDWLGRYKTCRKCKGRRFVLRPARKVWARLQRRAGSIEG